MSALLTHARLAPSGHDQDERALARRRHRAQTAGQCVGTVPAAAKWLQAPSGTGKSTLAASYARSRKKPLVWYRLDERDNDPAFFYAEFAQAVHNQLRLKKQLPKFSSDDHDRQQEFAQRFAAALSEQLAKPALFVLDDMQCITNEAMQRALAE